MNKWFFCLVSTNTTASYCFVGSNKRWVFQAKSLEIKVGRSNCWRLNKLFANESSTLICFFSTLLTTTKLGMKVSFYQSQVRLEKILKAFVLIPTPPGQSWTLCRFRRNLVRILICTSSHGTILGEVTRPKGSSLSPCCSSIAETNFGKRWWQYVGMASSGA